MATLDDLISGDAATLRERTDAYRKALQGDRTMGLIAAMSGDKTMGNVGQHMLTQYGQDAEALQKVPQQQQAYALQHEALQAKAAQNAAMASPQARQMYGDQFKAFGAQVPEGASTETLQALLPQAREAWQAKETVAQRKEAAQLNAETRRMNAQMMADRASAMKTDRETKEEAAAAKAFGADVQKSWVGRGSQAAMLTGKINAADRLREFARAGGSEGRNMSPQEMAALANEAGVLFTPGTAPHASFVKGLETPGVLEKGARFVQGLTGGPVDVPGSKAWAEKYADMADKQAALAQEQLKRWIALPLSAHSKYVKSHPEEARNILVNSLASFGVKNPENYNVGETGAVVEGAPGGQPPASPGAPQAPQAPVAQRAMNYMK
jgi:hypothetical protein